MRRDDNNKRILGIDPCPRGFGFAVLDAPDFLTDWGVAQVFGKKTDAYLIRIEGMIDRYHPEILVLPDPADYTRTHRLRTLAAALIRATASRAVVIRLVSKEAVRSAFPVTARTKYDRAVFITNILPDLTELLPPPRKIWQSEDARMNIFDALCLALATPEGTIPLPDAAHRPVY